MGLLEGKKALVFGVANDHSIAWGIAKAFHDAGRDGRLLVGREPHRAARPAAGGVDRRRRSSSRATSSPTPRSSASSARWGETPRRARHPRPRPRLREARGPGRRVRRHVARRVRARARRVRLLARRARPRGPAVPPPRLVDPDADLLRRREGRRQLQRDGRGEGRARGVGPVPRRRPRPGRDPRQRDHRGPDPDARGGRHRRLQEDVRRVRRGRAAALATSRSRTSARRAVYLASDLSSAVTGEVIYVDGGFNILGVPTGGDSLARTRPRATAVAAQPPSGRGRAPRGRRPAMRRSCAPAHSRPAR